MTLPATALILHLTTEKPKPIPKPNPTLTEQFVDAPPKDMYVNDWRERVKRKQKQKQKQEVNKPHEK